MEQWIEINWTVFDRNGNPLNENLFSVPRSWLEGFLGCYGDELDDWFANEYGEDPDCDHPGMIYKAALMDGVLRRSGWT